MPGLLVHSGIVMTCPHGGAVQVIPSDPLAPATAGVPVLTADARMVVVGCAAQPCSG
jgi:hypothetical protein